MYFAIPIWHMEDISALAVSTSIETKFILKTSNAQPKKTKPYYVL